MICIGIDIGTTNWKVAAVTSEGKMIAISKTPTRTHYSKENIGFYRPEEVWEACVMLLRDVTGKIPIDEVAAVSVTSMAESVVLVKEDGSTPYPMIAWFDTCAEKQAQEIRKRIGERNLFSITGMEAGAIFSVPKILWIKENYPDIFNSTYKWLQMTDFIYFKLCNQLVTDYSMASRTLAFDLNTCSWSDEILSAFDISASTFPEIVKSGSKIGIISKEISSLTGLPEGIAVVVGGHDHPCATISTGVLSGNKLLDSSGTNEAFIFVSEPNAPLPEKYYGQRMTRYLDPERYVLWGGIPAAGISVDWALKRFTTVSDWKDGDEKIQYEAIWDCIGDLPVGSTGVTYIPHLRGSGAPTWDSSDTGAWIGIKSTMSGREMVHAMLEGLACQAKIIVDMEEQVAGSKKETIVVVGGGARIRLLQEMKADMMNKRIEIPEISDATVMGAALLAGIGIGIYKSIEDASLAVKMNMDTIMPAPNRYKAYQSLFERYCRVNDMIHQLNRNIYKGDI